MGQGQSFSRITNDFELVVRATKELEFLLEEHFHAPTGKNVGLHDKITAARDARGQPLSDNVKKRMRYLVTIRNSLVHDRECNAIPDRSAFLSGWAEVETELKKSIPSSGSNCTLS